MRQTNSKPSWHDSALSTITYQTTNRLDCSCVLKVSNFIVSIDFLLNHFVLWYNESIFVQVFELLYFPSLKYAFTVYKNGFIFSFLCSSTGYRMFNKRWEMLFSAKFPHLILISIPQNCSPRSKALGFFSRLHICMANKTGLTNFVVFFFSSPGFHNVSTAEPISS